MKEILRLDHVTYAYEKTRPALNDVSVTLYTNQKVAVLGNNGAGKSTFFLCCNGIHMPQSGSVFLHDRKLSHSRKDSTALHSHIGLIFQDPDSQMIAGTVESEVSFGPMNLNLDITEVRSRVEDALKRMHLTDFKSRAPHYLSGGEKKRVSIADVLAMRPDLLLFDEPAASLDPDNTRLLESNLEDLSAQGLGLIISTHDVNFAWKWAERILLFHAGSLVADDTPEAVFSDQALLETCGLEQPLLYQVGKIYGLHPLPKTVQDLRP